MIVLADGGMVLQNGLNIKHNKFITDYSEKHLVFIKVDQEFSRDNNLLVGLSPLSWDGSFVSCMSQGRSLFKDYHTI